jgi:hypothetical protein
MIVAPGYDSHDMRLFLFDSATVSLVIASHSNLTGILITGTITGRRLIHCNDDICS